MQLSEFDYHLPEELIAQTPIEPRDHSRLLILDKDTGELQDKHFYNLLEELGENDVLVLNKTKVINARLIGEIDGGKQVEIFLHKQISNNTWDCLVYPGKKLKPGKEVKFILDGETKLEASIKDISDKGRIVEFSKGGFEFLEIVERLGQVPLPPYIKEKLDDSSRYQTVFNEISGSVAAPTAGLHFTPELIEKLEKKGVIFEKVLLHVGLGTFMGVETENILEHKMHSEYIELEKDVSKRLNSYKQAGKRIIAVGTTSIRVLESFADDSGMLSSGNKETSIFIYPGYSWKFVDAMITNFHLPKSTLLMLISSFAGKQNIKKAYEHAINSKYRFFSFGDAMFIK
ncbi:MAG: tRNA preQ1(34) S-adenosylmethionine ribosyltransferase-isomerase QueA [Candidatus Gracilibacteria bacterium]|nr:tRNA preQ1(34) S-adenosylmethionine ribosyltransferase-isomerase QueA [Candidatus Gracilibacteria bacterium]